MVDQTPGMFRSETMGQLPQVEPPSEQPSVTHAGRSWRPGWGTLAIVSAIITLAAIGALLYSATAKPLPDEVIATAAYTVPFGIVATALSGLAYAGTGKSEEKPAAPQPQVAQPSAQQAFAVQEAAPKIREITLPPPPAIGSEPTPAALPSTEGTTVLLKPDVVDMVQALVQPDPGQRAQHVWPERRSVAAYATLLAAKFGSMTPQQRAAQWPLYDRVIQAITDGNKALGTYLETTPNISPADRQQVALARQQLDAAWMRLYAVRPKGSAQP